MPAEPVRQALGGRAGISLPPRAADPIDDARLILEQPLGPGLHLHRCPSKLANDPGFESGPGCISAVNAAVRSSIKAAMLSGKTFSLLIPCVVALPRDLL